MSSSEPIMILVCVTRGISTENAFKLVFEVERNGTLKFFTKPVVKGLFVGFKDGVIDKEFSKDYLKYQKNFEDLPPHFKKEEDENSYDYFFLI